MDAKTVVDNLKSIYTQRNEKMLGLETAFLATKPNDVKYKERQNAYLEARKETLKAWGKWMDEHNVTMTNPIQ